MTDRKIPLAAAIFSVLNPATAALAQSAAGSNTLEPVIVTATRREVNLQDVSQSVTALSTEDIAKQAFQSLDDVAGALPSVTLVNAIPGRNDIIMRGISTGTGEYYTDSQVSVYLDDQPMTSSSQQVDVRLVDIERIEVLPGPQGTLFGSSSQSGTIRYVTNKPDPSGYSSQVDVEVGTTKGGEESYDVSGHVNIPLGENFAIRAVGFYAKDGGYIDNVPGLNLAGTADNADAVEKNWNDAEVTGGRLAALWRISPKWDASLNFVSQYDDTNGDWLTDPAIGDYKIVSFYDEYPRRRLVSDLGDRQGRSRFRRAERDGVPGSIATSNTSGTTRCMRIGGPRMRCSTDGVGSTTRPISAARLSMSRSRTAGPMRSG
jgi:outer membrane receptor protein involved in Fe transport